MPSYGPWVQDVDHLQWWTVSDSNPDNYAYQIERVDDDVDFREPVYPILTEDLFAVFETTRLLVGNKAGWIEGLSSGYDLSFPKWRSSWGCEMWNKTYFVGSREFVYHPSNYGLLPPEGAIGIDYETQPYTPETAWYGVLAENVGARIGADTEFQGKFEDGRIPGGELLPWASTTAVVLTPPDGVAIDIADLASHKTDTSPNWMLRDLEEPVDLEPWGALDPAWTATLHTRTTDFIVGGDPAPYEDTHTRYGWLLNTIRMEIDIRPPRFRWVYESTAAPYRRTFPRDDSLAGGARRTYPPSRASQSSNRTSGYL